MFNEKQHPRHCWYFTFNLLRRWYCRGVLHKYL